MGDTQVTLSCVGESEAGSVRSPSGSHTHYRIGVWGPKDNQRFFESGVSLIELIWQTFNNGGGMGIGDTTSVDWLPRSDAWRFAGNTAKEYGDLTAQAQKIVHGPHLKPKPAPGIGNRPARGRDRERGE